MFKSSLFYFKSNSEKSIFVIISFLFFAFAVYFNAERIYGDAAAYLFSVINSQSFQIAHNRPASLFIEFLPVLLIKLHLGLRHIILAFSINEWLYVFISSLIFRILAGNWNFSFAILFSLLIGVRYNYFNPVSELILGTPFFFLLFFILRGNMGLARKMIFFTLTALFLIFSHPIYCLLVPFLIVINYYATYQGEKKEALLISISCIILLIFRYFLSGNYDIDPLKEVGNSSQTGFGFLLKFNYAGMIAKVFPAYLGAFILFGITIFRLIKSNKKKLAAALTIFITLYFFIVMYKFGRFFPDTYEPFERYLYPIPLAVCLAYFVYCYKKTIIEHSLLLLIVIYHFSLIFVYGKFVKERYNFLNNAIVNCDQFNGYKFAYRNENYFPVPKGHDWIMSSESMLLSGIRGSDKVKQIIVKEYYPPDTLKLLQADQIIFFPFPMWRKEIMQINTDYFNLQSSPVFYVNTDTVQSNQPDSFFKNISINIGGHSNIKKNQDLLVPVIIHNDNCNLLYSGLGKEEVYISYHWIKNGKVIVWDGLRTPIMCDVKNVVFQFMKLRAPEEPGDYQLKADIVFEGKRWSGIVSENNRIYKVK